MRPFLHQHSAFVLLILLTSLAIHEKSYFILSAHRSVTFVGIFDVPFELADEAIVKRLEDFNE